MKNIKARNIICFLVAIFHFHNIVFAENNITGYHYDGLNRLLHTDMVVGDELETTDTYLSPDAQVGDMTCYYDRIGNHKYQKCYGPYNDSGQPNNHLAQYSYLYEPGRSRLDLMHGYYQAPDRLYDLDYNGNVIKDEARSIDVLRYNSNNLPTVMDNATYQYDGSDQRIVKDSGELETIYWRDNTGRELAIETNTNPPSIITTWQYNIHGNTLISHYTVPTTQYPDFDDIPLDPTPPAYDFYDNTDIASLTYYVTDHLGNTKLTFKTNACNAALSLESVIEYHPFGTKLREWNADESERYLFNGQERDVETGYDYFRFRMYDSEIARFNGVDPLSAKYPANSSYAFAENRVVNGIELEGLEFVPIQWKMIGMAVENYFTSSWSNAGDTWSNLSQVSKESSSEGYKRTVPAHIQKARMDNAIQQTQQATFALQLDVASKGNDALSLMMGGEMGAVESSIGIGLKYSNIVKGNLGNPFKGLSLDVVEKGFMKQVASGKLELKYADPISGSKSFKNLKSGYSYNLDTGLHGRTGLRVEKPHIDVNYPNPKPEIKKVKHFLDETPKEYIKK